MQPLMYRKLRQLVLERSSCRPVLSVTLLLRSAIDNRRRTFLNLPSIFSCANCFKTFCAKYQILIYTYVMYKSSSRCHAAGQLRLLAAHCNGVYRLIVDGDLEISIVTQRSNVIQRSTKTKLRSRDTACGVN